MSDEKLSEEQLNAFVDGQLDTDEKEQVFGLIDRDQSLARRTCELRRTQDLVRHAYAITPRPRNSLPGARRMRRTIAGSAAAGLFLAMGGLVGWAAHSGGNASGNDTALASTLAPATLDTKRVVLHISTADAAQVQSALDDAEELLDSYESEGRADKVQLEVVANAEGISLLVADASPYAERIGRLAARYDNVSFLACSRSLEKLKLRGMEVVLLPEATTIPGALEQIVTRLQEGWVYIKV